jgi:hypothetical protein
MEDRVAFGGGYYLICLGLLLAGRGMDFLSTWIATPNLVLEANPIAKKLGWKLGIVVNLLLCGVFALWPLPAIIIATTSILVAARNFQSAWLMRALGEQPYRNFMAEQMSYTPFGLYLFCLGLQTALYLAVGLALVYFGQTQLVPFAIGVGVVAYAIAVAFYSLLAARRHRHPPAD